MNDLSSRLNNATMTRLNGQVDVEKKAIEAVAKDFLTEQGLM